MCCLQIGHTEFFQISIRHTIVTNQAATGCIVMCATQACEGCRCATHPSSSPVACCQLSPVTPPSLAGCVLLLLPPAGGCRGAE